MDFLLKLDGVACAYGGRDVVKGFHWAVRRGEMASLLGPSGCGKSTLLRAIAGFIPLSAGEISLEGRVLSRAGFSMAPEKRRVGLVFQDYALFPHLSVANNIAFGIRHLPAAEGRLRVEEMLTLVGLSGLGGRFPHELSGGQQQRVALARSLAPKPGLILLDEPFSNLDVDLRERLSLEVRDILKAAGATAILVTHDQNEAFAMGERVAVMHDGRLIQWGTPFDIYHEPADPLVADFIGQGTFLPGTMVDPTTVETEVGTLSGNRAFPWPAGFAVSVLLRPDDVLPDPVNKKKGVVTRRAFKGAQTLYTLRLPSGRTILSLFPSHHDHAVGEAVSYCIAPEHLVLFPAENGKP